MSKLAIIGAILAIIGVVGLAVPYFTTRETQEVAHVGDLKVQTTNDKEHSIPPAAAGGVLAVGVVLLGAGLFRRA